VAAAEGGVDEVAGPGAALVHLQLVAVLGGGADAVEVREVDLRVDPLREEVQAQRDEVDVAGALPVAEQAALDPVRAREVAELGGGDGRAAVVVRVQRQDHVLARVEVPVHPLDRVGVDVRRGHLHRRRQVDDHVALGGRLEHLEHPVADLGGELELGPGVRLGRVLVVHGRAGHRLLVVLAEPRALDREVDDALAVGTEHHVALQDARRVVEVHDRLLRALDRLVRAGDQVLPRLREHLDRDVVRDRALLDEAADEVEVGLARRREADLDLLVAHADQ
jgi:hypothetical protein